MQFHNFDIVRKISRSGTNLNFGKYLKGWSSLKKVCIDETSYLDLKCY